MDEAERTAEYRKEPTEEATLAALNRHLEPLQRTLEQEFGRPRLPVVFIIGAPRSGTTLASQCLAYGSNLGYISNFVARFWRAPLVGARLERTLNIREALPIEGFSSEHGVTAGLSSPHEFGYFWSGWFDLGQDTHRLSEAELAKVDHAGMARRIAALESFYGAPMSFKNNTWCTFQASYLHRHFPDALFLVCRRKPIFIAQSMLRARRRRLGGEQQWWSVRPSSYRRLLGLPWWQQVVGQAIDIEREMDEALRGVRPDRIIEVEYQKLCARPSALVEAVRERLQGSGFTVQNTRELPERFQHTDVQQVPDGDWQLLNEALHTAGQWHGTEGSAST